MQGMMKAPIAALFWGEHSAGEPVATLAVRWSVNQPVCIRLGDGIYAVFEPFKGLIADATPLHMFLPGVDTAQYHLLTFRGVQEQATHPLLCPEGVLAQPAEVNTAQFAAIVSLAAKETARLVSAQEAFRKAPCAEQDEERPRLRQEAPAPLCGTRD